MLNITQVSQAHPEGLAPACNWYANLLWGCGTFCPPKFALEQMQVFNMGHLLFWPVCVSYLPFSSQQPSEAGIVQSPFYRWGDWSRRKITSLQSNKWDSHSGSSAPGPGLTHPRLLPLGPDHILMPEKSWQHMQVWEDLERLQNVLSNLNKSLWMGIQKKLKIMLRLSLKKAKGMPSRLRNQLLGNSGVINHCVENSGV